MRKAMPISIGTPSIAILMGTINITNYQQTKSPLTQITGQFDASAMPISVRLDAVTSAGYHTRWDPAANAIRCYQSLTAAADTEVANGVNVGTVGFTAFGKSPR